MPGLPVEKGRGSGCNSAEQLSFFLVVATFICLDDNLLTVERNRSGCSFLFSCYFLSCETPLRNNWNGRGQPEWTWDSHIF